MFDTLLKLKHRTTDPACSHFKRPTGWWSWRRFNRNRGWSCRQCQDQRSFEVWLEERAPRRHADNAERP